MIKTIFIEWYPIIKDHSFFASAHIQKRLCPPVVIYTYLEAVMIRFLTLALRLAIVKSDDMLWILTFNFVAGCVWKLWGWKKSISSGRFALHVHNVKPIWKRDCDLISNVIFIFLSRYTLRYLLHPNNTKKAHERTICPCS